MSIDQLVNLMSSYGYYTFEDKTSNLGWALEQTFKKVETPTIIDDRNFHFTWEEKYPQGTRNQESFTLYETFSVNDKGIKYEEKDRLFYFYSFGMNTSKVYRDDQLDQLLTDWIFDVEEISNITLSRQIKLVNIIG